MGGCELVDSEFLQKIANRSLTAGVIGLGYVGLPLAHAFCQAGLNVVGFDIDPAKIETLQAGRSYIRHFGDDKVRDMARSGRFTPSADFSGLANMDAILICVPTPLDPSRAPDLSYVARTSEEIAKHLTQGTLVVLESTTYPGTTVEIVQPILERSGLKAGRDFFLAFSPEREDPGSGIETSTIPKIVGGIDAISTGCAARLYGSAFSDVRTVRDTQTAEAVKITENVFRAVNIALVNELKVIYTRMGINVWDVIDAAKTKPFGYMAFYPGPGLGGHCIPIDPFYLSWRARNFGTDAHFIELAGEINRAMPHFVVRELADALSTKFRAAINGAKILIVGIAYKKNVDDLRESPAFEIMEMLRTRGAEVSYYDPYCPQIPRTREHENLMGVKSVAFDEATVSRFDAALVVTDHDCIDFSALVKWSKLVVDTRNATRSVTEARDRIVLA